MWKGVCPISQPASGRIATRPARAFRPKAAPEWALSVHGLRSLRGGGTERPAGIDGGLHDAADFAVAGGDLDASGMIADAEGEGVGQPDALAYPSALDFSEIDALLARSEIAITQARAPRGMAQREADPLIHDPDWDEDERLEEWRMVLRQFDGLPPILQAILALDAWNELAVLQRAPWLGRLLVASLLRRDKLTTQTHLAAFNLGLRTVRVERRRHRDREMRLLAGLDGVIAAAEIGLKEHDRLLLARQMLERRLTGRRTSSRLPELIELVLSKPLVSAGMIASELGVTQRAALRLVEELALREMTGRGRFRAWEIV